MIDHSTRLAAPEDADAVAALFDGYRQFYGQGADLELARSYIRERLTGHQSFVIVAEDSSGQLLGFCQIYPTFCSVLAAPVCTLYDLFVVQAARRSGVGETLLRAAERLARREGFARMDLATARTNTSAQSLYESLGWDRDEAFLTYSKRPVG